MASNMNVSVTLRFVDQFTNNVRAFQQQLQGLTRGIQDFNRAAGGAGANNPFGRMQNQIRGLTGEVRNLASHFTQLGRAITGAGAGGSFTQRQIADMRALIALQQQAIANNARMVTGPGAGSPGPHTTGGRGAGPGGAGWHLGRRGFNPNASILDRMEYRGVNLVEQAAGTGMLDFDRARTQLDILALPDELRARAELLARQYSTVFRSLSPAHVLDTFREIVTQFQNPEDAFRLLPHLLRVQDWNVLTGDTVEQARDGMLRLVRAIGLSGRLIGRSGEFTEEETSSFLDAYLRSRIVGGRDVSPDQAFQLMKYLKTTGQTLSSDAILEALVAMPDIRGNTFGNALNQLIIQLTGRSTQAAQRAMVAGGLGRITAAEGSGPHSFQVLDEVMLRDNPFEWVRRHITSPTGFLRRSGIDPLRASAAEIATALRPLFSNQSAENIANMIVGQQEEWRNTIANARGLNITEERRGQVASGSLRHGLVSARSQMMNALGTIADAFKFVLLPPIQLLATGLQNLAALVSPQTGNPFATTGMLAGGLLGAFFLIRSIARGLGAIPRMLLGGGLGFAFGGIGEALMGAMLLRGWGGGTAGALGTLATGAAGAAATMAGMSLGRRILAGLGWVLRRIPGFLLLSGVIAGIEAIATNWESIKPRILQVWEDLGAALPPWLGGQGDAGAHARLGQGMVEGIRGGVNNLTDTLGTGSAAFEDWFRTTPMGRHFIQNGMLPSDQALAHERLVASTRALAAWEYHGPLGPRYGAVTPLQTTGTTVTTGPINVTVNVTQPTNANPNAIGDAAGTAVRSGLRGALADTVPWSAGP